MTWCHCDLCMLKQTLYFKKKYVCRNVFINAHIHLLVLITFQLPDFVQNSDHVASWKRALWASGHLAADMPCQPPSRHSGTGTRATDLKCLVRDTNGLRHHHHQMDVLRRFSQKHLPSFWRSEPPPPTPFFTVGLFETFRPAVFGGSECSCSVLPVGSVSLVACALVIWVDAKHVAWFWTSVARNSFYLWELFGVCVRSWFSQLYGALLQGRILLNSLSKNVVSLFSEVVYLFLKL